MLVASMTALVASGWSACRVGLILNPLESAAFPRRTPKPVIHAGAARNVRCYTGTPVGCLDAYWG